MTSTKERIKKRLNERMTQAASVAAENRELEQRTREVASSPEGIMGNSLYSLFDTIDTRNRQARSFRFIGRRALARVKGRKLHIVDREYWDGRRIFKLDGGKLEARCIRLSAGETELDEEHTFTHQWLLKLDGPIQTKETISPFGTAGNLHCDISFLTTELNTGEAENELRYQIVARSEGGAWVASIRSFGDEVIEDEIATLGNGSYDQALSLIAQARTALASKTTESQA